MLRYLELFLFLSILAVVELNKHVNVIGWGVVHACFFFREMMVQNLELV